MRDTLYFVPNQLLLDISFLPPTLQALVRRTLSLAEDSIMLYMVSFSGKNKNQVNGKIGKVKVNIFMPT